MRSHIGEFDVAWVADAGSQSICGESHLWEAIEWDEDGGIPDRANAEAIIRREPWRLHIRLVSLSLG